MRRWHHRGLPAAKLAAGAVLILLVATAASYAAIGRARGGGPEHRGTEGPPPTATTATIVAVGSAGLLIVDHPHAVSTHSTARFRVFAAGEPALRCRLDRMPAEACGPISVYRGIDPGSHTFLVRARRAGQAPLEASFAWTVLEPKPFAVEPRPGAIGPLYPGAKPLPIPVVISNPNPVPIDVTALRVGATGGPPGCDPATNLALTVPDLGASAPRIPAQGALALPSAGVAAPTIALRELGVDQDACQGAKFHLTFSGSAGG